MKSLATKAIEAFDQLSEHNNRWLLILILALITRAIGVILGGEGGNRGDDDGMHINLALNFYRGEGYSMYWQELGPFYTFMPPGLATIHVIFMKFFKDYIFAERIFFLLMSSGTAVVFNLWMRQFFNSRTAFLLTLIFIFYPPQWFWSTRINSHTYSTNMMVICFYLLNLAWQNRNKWLAVAVGILWGTISLMRPEYMLGIFCLSFATFVFCRKEKSNRILLPTLLIVGWALMMSPWVIRNYIRTQRVILSSTHYSYNLWLVFNDEYKYGGDTAETPPELRARLEATDEMGMVDIWVEEGVKYIKASPSRLVKRVFLNLANFWRPWLSFNKVPLFENLVYIFTWGPIFILFLMGVFKIPWWDPKWLAIWSFFLYKMLAQLPFYMIVRFREAIFPLFVLIAGLALSALINNQVSSNKSKHPDPSRST